MFVFVKLSTTPSIKELRHVRVLCECVFCVRVVPLCSVSLRMDGGCSVTDAATTNLLLSSFGLVFACINWGAPRIFFVVAAVFCFHFFILFCSQEVEDGGGFAHDFFVDNLKSGFHMCALCWMHPSIWIQHSPYVARKG